LRHFCVTFASFLRHFCVKASSLPSKSNGMSSNVLMTFASRPLRLVAASVGENPYRKIFCVPRESSPFVVRVPINV
jgi:hypothetical protein